MTGGGSAFPSGVIAGGRTADTAVSWTPARAGSTPVQICNHNLLLADLIHRSQKKKPLLPDSAAIIIDEAHKLPETARQMFGVTLNAQDFAELIRSLHVERYVLAAELLSEARGAAGGETVAPGGGRGRI